MKRHTPIERPTADEIKLRLLAWLIPQLNQDELIASELRFLTGSRRADLAVFSPSGITAFEIKGPRDNLDRLSKQLDDYRRMFHNVYVAASEVDTKRIADLAKRSVGIIAVSANEIRVARAAQRKSHLDAKGASLWLESRDLRELSRRLGIPRVSQLDIESLRNHVRKKLGTDELNHCAGEAMKRRMEARHLAFIAELGRTPTYDDLKMLTIESKVVTGEP